MLFVVTRNGQLFKTAAKACAAAEVLTGPKQVVEFRGITHFEIYIPARLPPLDSAAARAEIPIPSSG